MYTIVYYVGSMYSQDNSPLVPNGGSLVQRVTPRNTPTLQLPISNNSSPRVPKRGFSVSLYVCVCTCVSLCLNFTFEINSCNVAILIHFLIFWYNLCKLSIKNK